MGSIVIINVFSSYSRPSSGMLGSACRSWEGCAWSCEHHMKQLKGQSRCFLLWRGEQRSCCWHNLEGGECTAACWKGFKKHVNESVSRLIPVFTLTFIAANKGLEEEPVMKVLLQLITGASLLSALIIVFLLRWKIGDITSESVRRCIVHSCVNKLINSKKVFLNPPHCD